MSVILSKSMQESRNRSNRKVIEKRQNLPYNERKPKIKRIPIKRKIVKIKPLSDKRAAQNREYMKLREQFLKEHPNCMVIPGFKSNEVHHKKGRTGKLLTDTRYWLAVSRKAHEWIEASPLWAYKMGYSVKRLAK